MDRVATAEIACAPVPDIERESAAALDTLFAPLAERRREPVSTYRLQMHKGFGFREAQEILPYLARLGVSDCYTSPLLQASPGSMHGYDITDHNRLNPELGSAQDYDDWSQALQRLGLGHVLDFVPNHMGIRPDSNPWWFDVLENGPSSLYASYFDIDWDPVKVELKNKVLLPILGDQYGVVLERGELRLVFEEGTLYLRYYDHRLPINPRCVPQVFQPNLPALEGDLRDDPLLREFLSIMTELNNLPPITEKDPRLIAERQREKEVARERLARLLHSSPRIQQHVADAVAHFNGQPGQPRSFDALHALLEAQPYRLAYWRTAMHEINYRRFFDVNQLAGLRMEWRDVFSATHRLVFDLVAGGRLLGLRLDHPDGLYDPAGYFDALQETFLEEWAKRQLAVPSLTPEWRERIRAWRRRSMENQPDGLAARPLYLAAEKILSTAETLPAGWAIDGTSGYDFLNDVNRWFVDGRNAARFREVYQQFTGKRAPLDVVVYVSKRLIVGSTMASELNVLAHALNRISEGDRRSRDFTLESLRDALREVVACFPVYRTYITAAECTPADRQIVDRAIQRAKRRNPATESSIFDFVRNCLIPHGQIDLTDEQFQERIAFAMKFQQYTGPVQAKGLEDTAFYRYNVLLSLNEVGGDPQRFGSSTKEFHDLNAFRRKHWPAALLATATHDTKRGEDARARLNVLSEIPDEWERRVARWSELLGVNRERSDREDLPEPNDAYLFFQTLLGVWPAEAAPESRAGLVERLRAYMSKAIKEAKLRTSWINPNDEYERAVDEFVQRALDPARAGEFLEDFEPFAARLSRWGAMNSLAQLVVKMTSPGVPDFYQGTELWDLSLVDPDNRRPVDYALRRQIFDEIEPWFVRGAEAKFDLESAVRECFVQWRSGKIKLYVTAAGLRLRRTHPDLFLKGDYVPLDVLGEKSEHVVAFLRRWEGRWAVTVAGRWFSRLTGGEWSREMWGDTAVVLPETGERRLKSLLTGASVAVDRSNGAARIHVADALGTLPGAILIDEDIEGESFGKDANQERSDSSRPR